MVTCSKLTDRMSESLEPFYVNADLLAKSLDNSIWVSPSAKVNSALVRTALAASAPVVTGLPSASNRGNIDSLAEQK